MKKTILTILLCGVMVLGLTGCNKSDGKDKLNSKDDVHTFKGIIVECEQNSMIVKPDNTEEEYKSSDKFRIEYVDGFNSCKIDSKVKITYEGLINESYPAQIGTTKIELID
ncbi:MAG: DUF3221 domain-containing protein [bacterium]|nr:DUF3221 domain-containing protein [bacterium]